MSGIVSVSLGRQSRIVLDPLGGARVIVFDPLGRLSWIGSDVGPGVLDPLGRLSWIRWDVLLGLSLMCWDVMGRLS